MKSKLIVALLLLANYGMAQDSAWYPYTLGDLIINLPGLVKKTDTSGSTKEQKVTMTSFQSQGDGYLLSASMTNEANIKVRDQEAWEEALTGMAKGFCNTKKRMGNSCVIRDTVINNLPARKVITEDLSGMTYPTTNYIFLVNDKMYILITSISKDYEANGSLINKFLSGISFRHSAIAEAKLNPRAENMGYLFGQILAFAVIIGIIIFAVFKKSKKQPYINKTDENKYIV